MLTDRQLMWFDETERTSLENWYGDGNRGRPWGRIIAFDTQRTRKVAEVTGSESMEKIPFIVQGLSAMREAEAFFLTYVGMTVLPQRGDWLSQKEVHELMLSGDPVGAHAGRALFTVGVDEHGYLYTLVNRFEVEDGGKLMWGKRMNNVLAPRHVRKDEMLGKVVDAIADGRKTVRAFRDKAHEMRGQTLPEEMEDASVVIGIAMAMRQVNLRLKLRNRPEYRVVESMLTENLGVTFYEESRG